MTDKPILLAETFRTILRVTWPKRPALADEIQSVRYFHSALWCHCRSRRIDPEAQAADEAMAMLKDGIMIGSVRLRGRLKDNLPGYIDPTEVAWNGIRVFDNTMEVYGEGGITLRTYRHVHCYEAELSAMLGIRPETTEEACARFIRGTQTIELKTHDQVHGLAKVRMPDLTEKEFERAWVATPASLKRGAGAPKKTPPKIM